MDGLTDNQQGKVTELERGWVAGFFDGEGSVYISMRAPRVNDKNNRGKLQFVRPECKMSATDTESLERMHDILTRAEIAHFISWRRPGGSTRDGVLYRMAWTITISGIKRTHRFLEWISDALTTKRERAELCRAFINSRLNQPSRQMPYTDSEMDFVQRMRNLNASKKPITLAIEKRVPRWRPTLPSTTTRHAQQIELVKV